MPSMSTEGETVFGGTTDASASQAAAVAAPPLTPAAASSSITLKPAGGGGEDHPQRRLRDGLPGEILAVLGPSGSGKSTLLNVLGGRLQGKHGGAVVANGRRPGRAVQRRTGFVPQDDVLYPHLTVRETLVFCALLRLPAALPRSEKVHAAEEVMAELGLSKCENTIRKRVSIGHEMLIDPSLLILDEPTSGLDSTAAHRVVAMLAGLAQKGKTVVASVHQPSSRVYQMFDKVLLLAEGRCLYLATGGTPWTTSPPLDSRRGMAQAEEMDRFSVKQTLIASHGRFIEPKVKASVECRTPQRRRRRLEDQRNNTGWFTQFAILLQRSLKERRHEPSTPSGDSGGGRRSAFWGDVVALRPRHERAIFLKERASGMYTLSSYFMARMAGDLPMELALPSSYRHLLDGQSPRRDGTFPLPLVAQVHLLQLLLLQNPRRHPVQDEGARIPSRPRRGDATTVSVAVLVGMFLGFRLLAYTALRRMKVEDAED
ncbi:unnamed protein product [Spirodela intermedia]|uniref:ABC transporter domain-containing protein n=1 Tax=Spirodela intermedia TaxID=51605 RepID=A0A7I8JE38_SPIIN|nr:unnamed protein product [Spirodela intermedia]CAA6668418.1 unnamed protein product [Spirodela intermedia]